MASTNTDDTPAAKDADGAETRDEAAREKTADTAARRGRAEHDGETRDDDQDGGSAGKDVQDSVPLGGTGDADTGEDAEAEADGDADARAEDGDADSAGGAADADDEEPVAEEKPAPRYFTQPLVEEVPRPATRGMASAVFAITGAALALASLTGTWLGTLMSDREQLIGQLNSSGQSAQDQISSLYGTPWHTVALFNGAFAVVGLVVVVVVLLVSSMRGGRFRAAPWVRAIAWSGVVLALLGLAVSGVMYFDLFAHLPKAPPTPQGGGAGGGPTG